MYPFVGFHIAFGSAKKYVGDAAAAGFAFSSGLYLGTTGPPVGSRNLSPSAL